jgi:hypothetical protein
MFTGLVFYQTGEGFSAADSLWMHAYTRYWDQRFCPRILIGNDVRINQRVQIAATRLIEIGNNELKEVGF